MVDIDDVYSYRLLESANRNFSFYLMFHNGKSQIEAFLKDKNKTGQLNNDLGRIRATIDMYHDNPAMPQTLFRKVSGGKRSDLYEFKSKALRAYAIKLESAFVFIRMGLKTNQQKDIDYIKSKFKTLKISI